MHGDDEAGPVPARQAVYEGVDEALTRHARRLREVLGDVFVGLYPLGSLAVGDFDQTSDVDFMVVTTDPLKDDDVARVQAAHLRCLSEGTPWVQRLEYSFISVGELHASSSPYLADGRRNVAPARRLWYFENGSDTIQRSDHDNSLVSRWTLRYRSHAVLGPEPAAFAPAIPPDALRREIRGSLIGWQKLVLTDASPFENRFHQVFLVLNNCRALQDLHDGRITSKKEGAEWGRHNLDAEWRPLIDYSWEERRDPGIHVSQPADAAAWARTIDFMTYSAALAEAYRLV